MTIITTTSIIIGVIVTLKKMDTQLKHVILFIAVLMSGVMLSVVMPNVFMVSVILLSNIMLSVYMTLCHFVQMTLCVYAIMANVIMSLSIFGEYHNA
jgi:hypothetical protein